MTKWPFVICIVHFLKSNVLALSPPSSKTPIKRVAVIGSGIAGLAVANGLTNSPSAPSTPDVTVFDARPRLDFSAGAGIQLNGGLAAMRRINEDIVQAIFDAGLPQSYVRSRCKPWRIGNSDEVNAKAFDTLLEINLKDAVLSNSILKDELIVGDDRQLLWCAIMRGALQEALLNCLPKQVSNIQFDKTLTGIRAAPAGNGAICDFSDGSVHGPFDLIVGCDGIKSAVKEYIDKGKISADASKREGAAAALYSGIRIRYAVQDGTDESVDSSELRQYFGDGAYALEGVYGSGFGKPASRCAFIVSLDNDYIGPFKKKASDTSAEVGENADWTQDVRKKVDESRKTMEDLIMLHNLPSTGIGPTIAHADRFFELGVYFHNPFSLIGWSKEIPGTNGCLAVLCGDAAHAMPPFLGQGANQAIQDACSLSMKIHQYNTAALGHPTQSADDHQDMKDLKHLLAKYEQNRWKPTTSIALKSAFLGYLETGGDRGLYAKFRDAFFFVMGKVGVARQVLLDAATPKL